jgi:hypothetical protein
LEGVDLTVFGPAQADIIDYLLDNGNLVVE